MGLSSKARIIILFLLCANLSFADWQESLEAQFDIVETFDQLQDWHGSSTGYIYTASDMPKKLDNSASIWGGYSSDDVAKSDWIKNHGPGYVWNGTKSLCINYNCLYDGNPENEVVGYGPSRIAMFFGDGETGKSGYKHIHVFFMVKFPPDFFKWENDRWVYMNGYLKTLELCSGFTAVNHFGTDVEYNSTCTANSAIRPDYGCNFYVFNWGTPGNALPQNLCYFNSLQTGYYDTVNLCNKYSVTATANDTLFRQMRDINITTFLQDSVWFAIEIEADIGTIEGDDGFFTVKYYNNAGVLVASESRVSVEALKIFDHYYNKLTIGGNFTRTAESWMPENRIFYDDIIVDDNEIAPTYFALLFGSHAIPNRAGAGTANRLQSGTSITIGAE